MLYFWRPLTACLTLPHPVSPSPSMHHTASDGSSPQNFDHTNKRTRLFHFLHLGRPPSMSLAAPSMPTAVFFFDRKSKVSHSDLTRQSTRMWPFSTPRTEAQSCGQCILEHAVVAAVVELGLTMKVKTSRFGSLDSTSMRHPPSG